MRWYQRLFRRAQTEKQLDAELRFHVEQQTADYVAAGMTPEEARRRVRMEFGGLEQVKEECRDVGVARFLETLIQDLRYGLRQLRRNPGFTAVAVITLALGIGANTAIFSLVDSVMLKSLPVVNPKQLVRLGDNNNCCEMTGFAQNGGSYVLYSYPLYRYLRDHMPEFSELAAFTPSLATLAVRRSLSDVPAEPYRVELVSGNYFAMFGIRAFAGRTLHSSDDRTGTPPVAVMGYHAWQNHFGLDPSVVGSAFTIDRTPYTVVGIAPPGFYGDTLRSDPPDFWLPLGTEPLLNRQASALKSTGVEWLYAMGRLGPAANVSQVESHLTVQLRQWLWQTGLAAATPQQRSNTALVEQVRQEIAQQHIRLTPAGRGVQDMQTAYATGLMLLMIIAGLVLLIACANIANLLLARGATRRHETAVRAALGAPRKRLIRQWLTESIVLSLAGGLLGLYVAFAGTRAILYLAFRGAHYVPISASPSLAVLGFAFLVSILTGVAFGIAPAWASSHTGPAEALQGAGRSIAGDSSLARRSLVVIQVAVSVVLLVVAGLVTQSLRNLQNQHFGFVTQGRLIVHVNPELAGYTPIKLYAFYRQLQERLAEIPGVLTASLSGSSPMEGQNWNENVYIEGRRHYSQDQNSSLDRVSSRYFETIGTRFLRGRRMADEDTPAARHEAVVNQTFVQKFFPGQDAIGHHFGLGDKAHSGDYEIVGVVQDAKYVDAWAPAYPTAFLPLIIGPSEAADIGDIELHVAGRPQNFERAVRRALASIDPNITVISAMSFAEQVALNFNQERLFARLTELFGLLALILVCVGLYGVTAYSVARRASEIGIRMALGATRLGIVRMVLSDAVAEIFLGLAIGVPLAVAGSRILKSLLFGVEPVDATILMAAALTLTLCALLAAVVPARRAAKVDPMVALRHE